ncbi:hypothetical protein TWF106_000723 [Orbilia oligospora]|uniref:Rab-GAP TBC domain-containing protein n=1 Tax=Orbilia oligospora TaxID=2813651 RepID=A0A7C8UAN0_ORBOL|nr:hypothetical protein TWF788_005996 [Orbilia oligospora]KAF3206338.1 hypothetical protein TWF106_000723 [Orbilia oligospora]KAF3212512.1 hypothetical protein TWF679_005703 [Orbilia oligospora]
MKNIHQVREQWSGYLRSISSFEALQAASLSDLNIANGIGHHALRSLLWKSLLLCHKLDLSTLIAAVRKERSAYGDHKAKYLRPPNNEQDPERFAGSDPLADDESSPWTSLRHDELLRDEIQKDIDRTYPDTEFFRSADVQVTLSNVLFVWSKLNPDTSYRQGMHELAAPVYWVIHSDAIEERLDSEKPDGEFTSVSVSTPGKADKENIMIELLDAKYIEHDTFSLFQKIMLFAKSWYEMGHGEEKTVGGVPASSPIVRKSEYIHEGLLGVVDPELAYHLDQLGVLPQIFLIRWVRLMFGREFTFDETLGLWDGIFVEDPTLQIVDYISVAMILRIRWKLLEADYSTALTLLLRYEPPSSTPPLTLLKDAIHLRDDLSTHTAFRLITKHTSRPPNSSPPPYIRSGTPPPPQPSVLTLSPRLTGASVVNNLHLNNIESLMHDVASKMRDRSERWGVNKALREAMGEVKRVSAGVGEQQRDILKRWTDSMERQTVLGAILEEGIKVLEEDFTAEITNEKLGSGSSTLNEAERRRKDAIERIKYVRNCLLDSKTALDRRWLTEVPDTVPNPGTPKESLRAAASAISPQLSSPPTSPPSFVSKPPPFPTYFHPNNTNTPPPPIPESDLTRLPDPITPQPPITTDLSTPPFQQQPQLPQQRTRQPLASPFVPKSTGLPLWKPPSSSSSRSVSETPTPSAISKPRRSLAQSQFAWMLGDDTADKGRGGFFGGGAGGGGGGGGESSSGSKSFSGPSGRRGGASVDHNALFGAPDDGDGGDKKGGLFGNS